ncbi:MAG: PqqD family protein [Acidobacteriota bacterium]
MVPSLSNIARISDDVVFRELEGEAVLLNMRTGTYFGLDAVGTRIWQLIEQHGTLSSVCDEIVKEFDVSPDAAARDILDLVNQLADRELVELQA